MGQGICKENDYILLGQIMCLEKKEKILKA